MTPEAEAAHRHGRMPPYTDDRGDLQEAWMRGYDAANHDAALAAEPIAASSRLDEIAALMVEVRAHGVSEMDNQSPDWENGHEEMREFVLRALAERLRATPEPEGDD